MGTKGWHLSEATRAKMSAAQMGNQKCVGHRHSVESRAKMSAALKGHQVLKATRMKLSAVKTGRRGQRHNRWKNGRTLTEMGYVRIFCPSHPWANPKGYVYEHRLIMEAHLGRTLLPTEVVHHINGIKDDNRTENLMLFDSNKIHTGHHGTLRREKNAS